MKKTTHLGESREGGDGIVHQDQTAMTQEMSKEGIIVVIEIIEEETEGALQDRVNDTAVGEMTQEIGIGVQDIVGKDHTKDVEIQGRDPHQDGN